MDCHNCGGSNCEIGKICPRCGHADPVRMHLPIPVVVGTETPVAPPPPPPPPAEVTEFTAGG